MTELRVEHVLMIVVASFLLYHLMGQVNCGCGNGFRVGGESDSCDGKPEIECYGPECAYDLSEKVCKDVCVNRDFCHNGLCIQRAAPDWDKRCVCLPDWFGDNCKKPVPPECRLGGKTRTGDSCREAADCCPGADCYSSHGTQECTR